MKTRMWPAVLPVVASGIGAVFFIATARGEIVRTVEQEFSTPAESFAGVFVETTAGNVTISSGADGRVRVIARQIFSKAASDAEADRAAASLDFEIAQNGSDVVASALSHSNKSAPVRVDFEVTVPPACIVDVKTTGRGTVTIGDVKGAVRVRTQNGPVNIGNVAGVVDARTEDGPIRLASASRLVTLETQAGDIESGPVGGKLEVNTLSGHIRLADMGGGVAARTYRGNISAKISGVALQECALNTTSGDVVLQTGDACALLLDAYAGSGRVYADDSRINVIAGGAGKSRCSGRINNHVVATSGKPGALVKVRSSTGNISIVPFQTAAPSEPAPMLAAAD